MPIPIFLFQDGPFCSYALLAIKQAHIHNPLSRIVFLTNDPKAYRKELSHLGYNVQCENLKDYYLSASMFETVYEHMSTNPAKFELPCFTRWFVIDEYCKRNKITEYFYLDNDVLLFCDIQSMRDRHFNNCVYTVTNNVSWGISLMNNTNWLSKFCDFCLNVYSLSGEEEKYNYSKIMSHYQDLRSNNKMGGVCDMTLIELFRKDAHTPPGLVGEMSSIVFDKVDNCFFTFDHNINQKDGFQMNKQYNIKEFDLDFKYPVCYNEILDQHVSFNCIHFQGAAKALMGTFVKC